MNSTSEDSAHSCVRFAKLPPSKTLINGVVSKTVGLDIEELEGLSATLFPRPA